MSTSLPLHPTRRVTRALALCASALLAPLALAGCNMGVATSSPGDGSVKSRLVEVQTCDELHDHLTADAIAKAQDQAWQMLHQRYDYWYRGDVEVDAGGDFNGPVAAPPETIDNGANDRPVGHTDTNTQVAGVDEGDIVETDGLHIYLLHGQQLIVVKSWPPAALAEQAAFDLEGQPQEMFVADGRAVIYSSVYFDGPRPDYGYPDDVPPFVGPRPVEPGGDPDPGAIDAGVPTDPANVSGGISADEAFADSLPPGPPQPGVPYLPSGAGSFTKITTLDVSGDAPVLVSEHYIEGYALSSRRHDDVARVIVQASLRGPIANAYGWVNLYDDRGNRLDGDALARRVQTWLEDRIATIRSASLTDWLPRELVREDGELREVPPSCADFYVPPVGQTGYGLTEVVTSHMDGGPIGRTAILGEASTVYANETSLLLAQPDYRWDELRRRSEQRSVLHRFALDGDRTTYEASGVFPGRVNNQFSIDERGGVVRIATTRDRAVGDDEVALPDSDEPVIDWVQTEPVNYVVTLAQKGDTLEALGSTPPMAPNERIQSARFVGDLAYVVTFRQIDPLFVVDLSDPAAPTVLGSLKIPGFSTYMQPLDDDHLLTIGRYVDPNSNRDAGLQLQIFDVSDPTNPVQMHTLTVRGYSSAQSDHRAFIFDRDKGLLAIPVEDYGYHFSSTLRLFHVSIDDGFAEAGSISHDTLFADCVKFDGPDEMYVDYSCNYPANVRRGLFIDDYVYAISYGGVSVHALPSLEEVGSVKLPQPQGYFGGWYPPEVLVDAPRGDVAF